MGRGLLRSLLGVIYVIIGFVVADDRHYFGHLTSVKQVVSGALAIVLWPLVLAGVSFHLH